MRIVTVDTTEPGVVKLETKLQHISKPGGRELNDILNDISEINAPEVIELVELIDFLVSRLTFADAARFDKD